MAPNAESSETDLRASISKARAAEKTRSEAVTKAEASLKARQQKLEASDAFKAVLVAKRLLKEEQSALKSAKDGTAKLETKLRQHKEHIQHAERLKVNFELTGIKGICTKNTKELEKRQKEFYSSSAFVKPGMEEELLITVDPKWKKHNKDITGTLNAIQQDTQLIQRKYITFEEFVLKWSEAGGAPSIWSGMAGKGVVNQFFGKESLNFLPTFQKLAGQEGEEPSRIERRYLRLHYAEPQKPRFVLCYIPALDNDVTAQISTSKRRRMGS